MRCDTARRLRGWSLSVLVAAALTTAAHGQVNGFVEDFSGPGTNGWTSFNSTSNPGSGGVGGDGDGFLYIKQQPNPSNFGTHNDGINYAGNWTAAGITSVSFYLNDIGSDQTFSFHFLVTGDETSGNGATSYQYNIGFDPPVGYWQQYTVDFSDPGAWTRIRGNASLSEVLVDVADAHFRHDLSPYITSPDPIAGDIGIDNIMLLPEPGVLPVLAGLGLVALRRRRPSR